MAITSEQIAAIINQQSQGFASAQGHTSATASMAPYTGSEDEVDPRAPRSVDQGVQAAGIGGMAGKAIGWGGEAMTMASAFGYAPRVLDPFTNALSWGLKGKAAAGWGGAFAMGGVAYAASSALTAPIGFAASNMTQGAQERGFLNAQLGNMMPNMEASQLGMVSSQLEGMNRGGMGGLQELTSIMGAGASSGALNISSIAEFQASFQRLVSDAKQMATTLKVSLTEGYQALESVKSMGLSTGQAQSLVGSFHGLGQASGLGPSQLFSAAAGGAQLAQQAGISAFTGAMGAVTNESLIGMTARMGALGGVNAGANAQFTSAAYSFFNQRQGQQVLAAMMSDTGGLDPVMAQRVAAGVVGKEELTAAATRNTSGKMRDIFTSRNQELAAQFVSDYGPQSIMGGLKATTSGSDMQQSVMQALTGMNRHDLSMMDQVAASTPMLKARLMEEARAGASEGQQRQSIGDIISKAIDKFTRPYRDKFRMWGEGITQSVQETVESFTNEFLSTSSTPVGMGSLQQLRMDSAAGRMSGPVNHPGRYKQSMASMLGVRGAGDNFGSTLAHLLPSGARAGALGIDGDFSQLPMYGLANESYQPILGGLSAAALAEQSTASLTYAMGTGPMPGVERGALWKAGRGFSELGQGVMRGIGEVGAGSGMATGMGRFMEGWAGRGIIGGSAAVVGGSMKLGGMLARGAGRLLGGPVGTAMAAYDLTTNVAPWIGRSAGLMEDTEGAVAGDSADALKYLEPELMSAGISRRVARGGALRRASNALANDVLLEGAQIKEDVYGVSDLRSQGMTPVAGTQSGDWGMTKQMVLLNKPAEMRAMQKRMSAAAAPVYEKSSGLKQDVDHAISMGLSGDQIELLVKGRGISDAEAKLVAKDAASRAVQKRPLTRDELTTAVSESMGKAATELTDIRVKYGRDSAAGEDDGATVSVKNAASQDAGVYNDLLAKMRDDPEFFQNFINFTGSLGAYKRSNASSQRAAMREFLSQHGIGGVGGTKGRDTEVAVTMALVGGFGEKTGIGNLGEDSRLGVLASSMEDEVLRTGSNSRGRDLRDLAAGQRSLEQDYALIELGRKEAEDREGAVKRTAASFYSVGLRGDEASAVIDSFSKTVAAGADAGELDYKGALAKQRAGLGEVLRRSSAMGAARLYEKLATNAVSMGEREAAAFVGGFAQVSAATERHRGKKKDSVAVVAELTGGMTPELDSSLGDYFSGKKSQFSQRAEDELRHRASSMLGTGAKEEDINMMTQRLLQLGKAQASGEESLIHKAKVALAAPIGTHASPISPKAGDPIKFAASVTAVTEGLEKLARALDQLPPQNMSGGAAPRN